MTKNHKCEAMDSAEAWIEIRNTEWQLNINRVATEQDLEQNHYLEEIGQTVETIIVDVLYCPYCGQELNKGKDGFIPFFKHFDFSKW